MRLQTSNIKNVKMSKTDTGRLIKLYMKNMGKIQVK